MVLVSKKVKFYKYMYLGHKHVQISILQLINSLLQGETIWLDMACDAFVFLIFQQNILCNPSLELSCLDGSNKGSGHIFLLRRMENYP